MKKQKKEPRSKVEKDSIQRDLNIRKINDILIDISKKVIKKGSLPNNPTERETFVCLAIIKVLNKEHIYFLKSEDGIFLNYQKKWYEVERDVLSNFLIYVGIKLGLNENQLLRPRDTKRLVNCFTDLTSRETLKKIRHKNIDCPEPKPKLKNPFKEGFLQIGEHLYIENNNVLSKTTESALQRKYGKRSLAYIDCYIDFKLEPEHLKCKRRVNGEYYNLYSPLIYKPKEGNWNNIEKMLKHLFRGKHYEMILTYLWVMYMKPKQPLPLIALTSKLKGTGKTTFLEFLKAVFGMNAKFIDAEDVSSNFNSGFMEKLVILIDEKIDGKKRKSDLQKYKKLITGGTQTLKKKYKNDIDIYFIGKFVLCSNDIETMLSLEDDNTRFWVIEVFPLESDDFDIMNKIKEEIPAFLHYLQKEYKQLEKQSRLWLNIEDIQTERGKIMQQNSRSEVAKEITERLDAYFIANPEVNEIQFSSKHFLDTYPDYTSSSNVLKNVSINYFSRVLKDEFNKKAVIKSIHNPFKDYFGDAERCRCFIFLREEIIKDDDIEKNDFDNN